MLDQKRRRRSVRVLVTGLSRANLAFAHDVVMAAIAFVAGFVARYGWGAFTLAPDALVLGLALFTLISASIFRLTGLYRGIWRYASLDDLFAIVRAATLAALFTMLALFLATRAFEVPRLALVIAWAALIVLLTVPRFVYRLLKDRHFGNLLRRSQEAKRVPVLLIGAGDETEAFIRAMARRDALYRVVAIIDDKGRRTGQAIRGVTIAGAIDDIPAVVASLAERRAGPQRIVITRDLPRAQIDQLLDLANRLALSLARLPRLTDFKGEGEAPIEVRPIALEDLLNRPQATLDRSAIAALVAGRRVMVTGAGGSIGSELVRQIAALGPARLALIDHSEYALYLVDLELQETWPDLPRSARLADIRNRQRLGALFVEERPHLVFHAAALKHVPMVEANPEEGVLTNVIGTRNVADLARDHGVGAMVMISTDKAVNPANVMGATKRLAEAWCQTLDRAERKRIEQTGAGTRFVTVRFGNVLGSTGSVVPLFQRQLARGGPLTVTHPDMTRYFMTVREAVELVLQASSLGVRDRQASGKIFMLDMGEPVRIVDLARQMIRLAGLQVDRDVKIVFSGLRPGEKLEEELFHAGEAAVETAAAGILLASPRTSDGAMLARALDELEAAARSRRTADALQLLAHLVPEYRGDPPGEERRAAP